MQNKTPETLRFMNVWLVIGFSLVVLVICASLIRIPAGAAAITPSDKVCHFIAYFCLTFWFSQIYRRGRARWAIAFIFAIMGVGLECAQGLTDYRSFEYADMAANAGGAACGLAASQTRLARTFAAVERCIGRIFR